MTGASEGIGEAIVRRLAIEGNVNVVMAARQYEKLKNIIADLNSRENFPEDRLMAIKCDVTSREEVNILIEKCLDCFGRIDILVNCAGCMYYCMIKNGYTDVLLSLYKFFNFRNGDVKLM